jgi:hypothetical protein
LVKAEHQKEAGRTPHNFGSNGSKPNEQGAVDQDNVHPHDTAASTGAGSSSSRRGWKGRMKTYGGVRFSVVKGL